MDYSFLYRYSFFGILQRNVKLGLRHYHQHNHVFRCCDCFGISIALWNMVSSGSVPRARAAVALSSGLITLGTEEESFGSYFFSMEIKP